MSSEMIAGMSSLITAVVSAAAAAVVLIFNARSNVKQKEATTKQNEYEKLLARYENDLKRREIHEEHTDEVVDKLKEANAKLRERLVAYESKYIMIYDYASRQYEFMKKQGIQAEAPPAREQPPPAQTTSSDDINFAVRQVAQESSGLKRTRPQPPGEPPESTPSEDVK